MQKLHPENQITITEDIVTKILKAYAISDCTFRPIEQGIENTSLLIDNKKEKYILRIYAQNSKSDAEIAFELSFQDYLRTHKIPIPLIYKNTARKELTIENVGGKQWQCILMEFIDGQSVTEHASLQLITELATIQAKMHLLGIEFAKEPVKERSPWTELRNTLVNKVKNISLPIQEAAGFIERVKNFSFQLNPELPHGYNHLDIDFDGNVIVKNSTIAGIIDFDDLEYSPAIVCLGYTLWNILDDIGTDAMHLYLQTYEKIRPLTKEELAVLPQVIFFRNYEIGIVRLCLWDEKTPTEEILKILRLEKDIPNLRIDMQ